MTVWMWWPVALLVVWFGGLCWIVWRAAVEDMRAAEADR
jgi:hypothetical protein